MWRIKYIDGPMDGEMEDFHVVSAEILVAYAARPHRRAVYRRENYGPPLDGVVRFVYECDRDLE